MSELSGQNLNPYITASQAYFAEKDGDNGTPRTSFAGSVTEAFVTMTYGITMSQDGSVGTAAVDITRHSPNTSVIFPDSLEENNRLLVNLLHNAMGEVPAILAETPESDEDDYVESFGIRLAIIKNEYDDEKEEQEWKEMIASFVFPISLDTTRPTPAYSFEPLGYKRKAMPFAMGAVAYRAVIGDSVPQGFPEFWTYADKISFD